MHGLDGLLFGWPHAVLELVGEVPVEELMER
jgi:hypothetical protein